ncbi:CBS domain-containing protein [Streptomyces canus]|uniref:CBS domain-containing protein n=1 Tax=Streptomyces canus TaxID=58343 RepID=UPI003AF2B8DD
MRWVTAPEPSATRRAALPGDASKGSVGLPPPPGADAFPLRGPGPAGPNGLCPSRPRHRIRRTLSSKAIPSPIAHPDDTALEVAALMAQVRSPLVAVAEKAKDGTHLLGVITASHLLHELLGAAGAMSPE